MCNFDKWGERGCLSCELADCIRDDILDDVFIEEPPPEKDNSAELYEDRYGEKQGKRKYVRYKGTYWDDEHHRKAREYEYRKRHGIPQEPRVYVYKGRKTEYQREYRAQMPPEQRERYLAWQREYNRTRRKKEKQGVKQDG